MGILIGINARSPKVEDLKAFGRELITKKCSDCGDETVLDAEAFVVAGEVRVTCSACVDRALPIPLKPSEPTGGDAWLQFGDGSVKAVKFMRPIAFPPPVASYEPERLDVATGLAKVARAGAPPDAIESVERQVSGDLTPSRATEAALNWFGGIRIKRPLLALMGPTGCGKSTASARVALEFARDWPWNSGAGGGSQREPLVWLNAEDVARLQVWQRDGARQYDEALHARMLIIDDAGHEDIRPAIAAMTDLLMRRIDARRATVLSTNLRGKAIEMRYGKPVADRLATRAVLPELGSQGSLRRAETVPQREPGED